VTGHDLLGPVEGFPLAIRLFIVFAQSSAVMLFIYTLF